jgi:microcystin degradation protein MlrC
MIRHAQAIEASPGGLSAGMFIGNPFTDVTDLRSNSFVVTDGDVERASREALQMANDFWAVRQRLQAPLHSVEQMIDAVNNTNGTVILKDAADATSSGASGDSATIVEELIKAGYQGRVLAPVVDEAAVQAAMAAGVGNEVETTVGGSLDSRFHRVPIRARVHMISEGRFISESNNSIWQSGLTAVLVADNVTWVVTSRSVSLYDRSLFYAHGQEPRHFDAVVVKSPHCQHHMFDAWAGRVLNVDVAGSTSANLPTLGHKRVQRPIFPLDANVEFAPEVKIFRR